MPPANSAAKTVSRKFGPGEHNNPLKGGVDMRRKNSCDGGHPGSHLRKKKQGVWQEGRGQEEDWDPVPDVGSPLAPAQHR